jgi:hypothetical protein
MNLKTRGSDGGMEEGPGKTEIRKGCKEKLKSMKFAMELEKGSGNAVAEGVEKAVESTVICGSKEM